jgi:hypothetical protein
MILQNVTSSNQSSFYYKLIHLKQIQFNQNLTYSIHFQISPLKQNISYLIFYQFDQISYFQNLINQSFLLCSLSNILFLIKLIILLFFI